MKRTTRYGLLLLSLSILPGSVCKPPKKTMVLIPAQTTVAVNDSFTLLVETRNFSNVDAFGFLLDYDPALLQLDGPIDLQHGSGDLSIVPSPQGPGKVEVSAATGTGIPSSGTTGIFLASIPFRALAPGQAIVTFDSGETMDVESAASGPDTETTPRDPSKGQSTITVQ